MTNRRCTRCTAPHLSFVICHGAELQARLQKRSCSFPSQLGKQKTDHDTDEQIREKVGVDIQARPSDHAGHYQKAPGPAMSIGKADYSKKGKRGCGMSGRKRMKFIFSQ